MKIFAREFEIDTRGNTDIVDIAGKVEEIIRAGEIETGVCVLFTPSSTSSLTTIEFESGCLEDLRRSFERIVPSTDHYAHNARWGEWKRSQSHPGCVAWCVRDHTDSKSSLNAWYLATNYSRRF